MSNPIDGDSSHYHCLWDSRPSFVLSLILAAGLPSFSLLDNARSKSRLSLAICSTNQQVPTTLRKRRGAEFETQWKGMLETRHATEPGTGFENGLETTRVAKGHETSLEITISNKTLETTLKPA